MRDWQALVPIGKHDMMVREMARHADTCSECQRLDRVAQHAALELTLLEAAQGLRRSDPEEYERFNSLIDEARQKQRQSQIALGNHASLHSLRNIRAAINYYHEDALARALLSNSSRRPPESGLNSVAPNETPRRSELPPRRQ